MELNFQTFPFTLASSAPKLALGIDPYRNYLAVQNTGTGRLTIGFSSAPSAAGVGPSLDPASAAGGQGGSWEWTGPMPMNSIYLYSAAGTTAVVVVGK
jgi:hypothetical protein